jgi:hypothetical protein
VDPGAAAAALYHRPTGVWLLAVTGHVVVILCGEDVKRGDKDARRSELQNLCIEVRDTAHWAVPR